MKGILEKSPLSKIEEDVVFIVDDLAEFDGYEISNLVRFLRVVNERGAKILFVKRIDDTGEGFGRYFNLLEFLSDEYKGINLEELLFRGAKDFFNTLRERIFLMDSAEKKEFANLLEANGYSADAIENKLKFNFDKALDIIHKASAGTICIALYMLEMNFTADEMRKIAEAERYYSFSEIGKAKEDEKRMMVESNKTLRLSGLFEIYRKLIENPCYIALILGDLAEDEIEMFCKDERIAKEFDKCHRVSYRDDYYWILESYEEEWVRGKRKVYRAKEMWRKFGVFLDALCEFHHEGKKHRKRPIDHKGSPDRRFRQGTWGEQCI